MSKPAREWFEHIVASGGQQLRTLLRRRVRHPQDVPDLVQEVYLRLLRMPEDAAIVNPEAYIFTVASNLAREHAVLTGRLSRSMPHEDPDAMADLAFTPAFDEEIDAQARATRLQSVLAELSPKCRAAVVLHYREGLSYAEVGLRLGVSSNMIKKYVVQALGHCRKRMGSLRE